MCVCVCGVWVCVHGCVCDVCVSVCERGGVRGREEEVEMS